MVTYITTSDYYFLCLNKFKHSTHSGNQQEEYQFEIGARGGSRTPTHKALVPKTSASTSSATLAPHYFPSLQKNNMNLVLDNSHHCFSQGCNYEKIKSEYEFTINTDFFFPLTKCAKQPVSFLAKTNCNDYYLNPFKSGSVMKSNSWKSS